MITESLEGLLTPSAKQILDELADDFRAELLAGARDSAARFSGELREISVHDLLRSYTALRAPGRHPRSGVDRILDIYLALGAFLLAVGLVWYAVQVSARGQTLSEQLPFVLAVLGLALTAVSLTYRRVRSVVVGETITRPAGVGRGDDVGALISMWRDIELALKDLAASRLGESVARSPVSALLDALRHEQVIGARDEAGIRELLRTRNQLLHSSEPVSSIDLEDRLRLAERTAERLRHLVRAGAGA